MPVAMEDQEDESNDDEAGGIDDGTEDYV